MIRLFRRLLWALIRLTDPPASRLPKRKPGETQVRYADPPKQKTIPLPAGTPRHHTVKLHTPKPTVGDGNYLPGSRPPEVRQS